jgi:hypothetical protein
MQSPESRHEFSVAIFKNRPEALPLLGGFRLLSERRNAAVLVAESGH